MSLPMHSSSTKENGFRRFEVHSLVDNRDDSVGSSIGLDHFVVETEQNDVGIHQMHDERKQRHVIDLRLQQERGRPVEIDQSGQLDGHPHSQVETREGPRLQNQLLVTLPLETLLLQPLPVQKETNVDHRAAHRYAQEWSVVVEEQVPVSPLLVVEIARPFAEHLRVVVVRLAWVDEYRADEEAGRIANTEGQWSVVKEDLWNSPLDQLGMKDEPVSFQAGECHEKEIGDIDGILKAVPERTERIRGGRDV